MMAVLKGVVALLSVLTLAGIVWWSFAKFRAKDNEEASMLPFALPDEPDAAGLEARSGAQIVTRGTQ
jgi:cytochrome c oxidase cbb3-type subunit 4